MDQLSGLATALIGTACCFAVLIPIALISFLVKGSARRGRGGGGFRGGGRGGPGFRTSYHGSADHSGYHGYHGYHGHHGYDGGGSSSSSDGGGSSDGGSSSCGGGGGSD